MKKLLTKLSPIGMLMDDPDKLKYVSPIAMLLSSGNKDKDNKNQTNQVTRQTEQAKQQSFKKGGQITDKTPPQVQGFGKARKPIR
jgi:hypothetical protein